MNISPKQALKDSLKSGNYSDIIIVCGHDTYYIHKAIMYPRSKYFETVFKADMQENRTSCVNLSDYNPDAIKFIIDFFYFTDYEPLHKTAAWGFEIKKKPTNFEFFAAAVVEPEDITAERGDLPTKPEVYNPLEKRKLIAINEPASLPTENPNSEPISFAESLFNKAFLFTHCHVYVLAEYLQIGDFKVLAAGKFRAEAEKRWNYPNFFETVQEVYRTSVRSDRLLRDVVVNVMKRRKELLDRFKYQDVVSQFNLVFKLFIAVKTREWG
ncbi:hypothetical protein PpBr36_02306 [Pyricularia pennisetigena]|uniref:hypothetical protein n=1 Tax=Pyricularia pennisetigena TaxID=1578925 RepID=UPI0011511F36|nr:hypothetical protein PpBr36_02306 [Pyricularia pennisetigena]TLS30361.1 hypothetical protein PpBr36_02306 [Pyricularia pennisetigena]